LDIPRDTFWRRLADFLLATDSYEVGRTINALDGSCQSHCLTVLTNRGTIDNEAGTIPSKKSSTTTSSLKTAHLLREICVDHILSHNMPLLNWMLAQAVETTPIYQEKFSSLSKNVLDAFAKLRPDRGKEGSRIARLPGDIPLYKRRGVTYCATVRDWQVYGDEITLQALDALLETRGVRVVHTHNVSPYVMINDLNVIYVSTQESKFHYVAYYLKKKAGY
jgi:hypothetical protein